MALGFNPLKMHFLDKPYLESIARSLNNLKKIGAIEKTESVSINKFGMLLSQIPLDTRLAKLAILGYVHGYFEEMNSIAAMMSGNALFFNSKSKNNFLKS